MDPANRRRLARDALAGYPSGPAATAEATDHALAKIRVARSVVLVEGPSDQIALETLATRRNRDLDAGGVVILPVGGAQAMGRYLSWCRSEHPGVRLGGLCDAGEVQALRYGLAAAGFGSPHTQADLEQLGFHVCAEDLEDELIRAVGPDRVLELFASQGDLGSFRTLQKQPAWRAEAADAQLRRFLGSGASRKLRYARLLVMALDLSRVPRPLDAVLAYV